MSRLKILFIPHWYSPEGGPFIREHARAASLYNDVVVIYLHYNPQQAKGRYEIIDNVEQGIRTLRVEWGRSPVPRTSFLIRLKGLHTCFRKLVKEGWKPDIIHAHVFPAAVGAVILGRLYRIPVVITEHYTRFVLHNLTLFDRLKARFAMNRAAIVLPVSDSLKRHIESYGIKSKFTVVPNTVDTEVFYPSHSPGEQSEVRKILLVAYLSPQKGINYLLESLSQLKEKGRCFVLDIVGDGESRDEYEKQAKVLELDDIVHFHGRKSKHEVAEFMRRCDFFVQPSLYETFGVVYAEAMACGKPVVATDIEGPNEIVSEQAGILVPPADVQALGRAIEFMLDNYASYSSQQIEQFSRESFSYETIGKMLDKIYHDVVGRKGE